ncbi:DUF2828 domain-containing protein [Candidatus Pacearchaeota archaeon]|jgi:hypothetical protein|nr:DUF2828 domain-containing protein [Candidatus Pacearchaeota archaeon]
MIKTHEGANQYEHSLDHAVEFFSKAGSLFKKKESFYEGEESALSLFQKIWIVDPVVAFKLLLWLRDARGGSGNRSAARSIYKWLAQDEIGLKWLELNIGWLPLVGRWDDLRSLFNSDADYIAADMWASALCNNDVLAAKWADRKDKQLRVALGIKSEKDFRKFLAKIRKDHIVEHKMCTNRWNEIEYKTVPSVAMARYTNAFGKHDEERFAKYKEALEKGEATIHASVLFPHDCVRTVRNGDKQIGDAQFEALPNYMDTDSRAIVIADTSGSMSIQVSGSIKAVDISQGMALYCSAKIPKENPFHKKFIGFESEGKFKDWNGMKFSEAVFNNEIFDGAIGETRIDKVLDLILSTAKFFNLTNNMMPNMLIIVSDMQFHEGTVGDNAVVENSLDKWVVAGYSIPSIVYWNTSGYAGQPVTVKHNNVALVSGFSPSILKAIFAAEDLTPKGIMLKVLEKYNIEVPK